MVPGPGPLQANRRRRIHHPQRQAAGRGGGAGRQHHPLSPGLGPETPGPLMRAAIVRAWGTPESVAVEDMPDPEPGLGQVLVRVESAAVNYPDVLIVANKYQVSI